MTHQKLRISLFIAVYLLSGYLFGTLSEGMKTGASGFTTEDGVHVIKFETLRGNIYLNLPDDMARGDQISGKLTVEPKGRNQEEQSKNRKVLDKYVIEIGKQITRAGNQWGKWKIADTKELVITLKNTKMKRIDQCRVPVIPNTRSMEEEGFQCPKTELAGRLFQYKGKFDGDFSNTHAVINNNELIKWAESPRKLILLSPKDVTGATTIKLNEADYQGECQFRNISMQSQIGKSNLLKGETTTIRIIFGGLEGLKEAIPCLLENKSPHIVNMEGQEETVFFIEPEHVEAGGVYRVTRNLIGITPGNFHISVSIPILAGAVFGIKLPFKVDDPTLGVPGVMADKKGELTFNDADAVRKWVALKGPEEKLDKLKKQIKKHEKRIADNQEKANNAKNDTYKNAYLNNIKNAKADIKALQKKIKLMKSHLKKARDAAKACKVEETQKWSRLAKEAGYTGRDTSGGNQGFRKPKKGQNSLGVTGPRGKGNIRGTVENAKKYEIVSKVLQDLEKLEKLAQDLEADLIILEMKIEEAEKKLPNLKKKLQDAEKQVAEMKKLKPQSMEGTVMLEEAEAAVKRLKKAIENLEKAINNAKADLGKKKKSKAFNNIKKALDRAYKDLALMYQQVDKCNTKGVERYAERIKNLLKNASQQAKALQAADKKNGPGKGGLGGKPGKGAQKKDVPGDKKKKGSPLDDISDGLEEAEKKAEEADKAVKDKVDALKKADKKYLDGLYDSLHRNFKRLKGKEPHKVDDFLKFKGSKYKKVSQFTCTINGKAHTVIVNLRWGYGGSPQPDHKKPRGTKKDGKYEFQSEGYKCVDPIIINIIAKVILYWVGPYSDVAANKALLYHEYLHGQLMVEWLTDPVSQRKLCEAIKKVCEKTGDPNAPLPLTAPEDEEHKKIDPWQKKYQEDIDEEEKKRLKKEKEKFRKEYKEGLK
jgi:hypothetical protein